MTKRLPSLICIVTVFFCIELQAQRAFLSGDGVGVFYPAGFDSSRTLPSFAVQDSLLPKRALPADWSLKPVFSVQEGKAVVTIAYQGRTDLYGNGEVTGPLRRNETSVQLWNTDNYAYGKANGERLYQSHPWIMGVREDGSAFGIIADHTWKGTVQAGNPIVFTAEGPSFRVIILEQPDPASLMKALARLTGTIELPPLWALGYHQSRYSYYPDTKLLQIARGFRQHQMPADVLWLDIDYMQQYKIFTFDPVYYPDPRQTNDSLHALSFRTVYMIDPGVKKEEGYAVYESGSRGDHWVLNKDGQPYIGKVWPGDCVFPDFTRPDTRTWWASLYSDFMKKGIDGVWNDMNEPAVFDGPDGSMPEDNLHRGGGGLAPDLHRRYHNVYGMLMVKASREGIVNANPGKRPFILSRASFLGGQRYAATWTGDNLSTWQHLKLATPMVLNLGLSGQPFSGPDVGGFSGEPDPVLYAHWMSVGAFYPFFRGHASKNTKYREPWELGAMAETESRKALNRRYQLLPYLYTLFRESSLTGMPVMRPVFFADPTDTLLRREQEAFMLGSHLLVVPKTARNAHLPAGRWLPVAFNGEVPGKETVQPDVYIKGGTIVPLAGRQLQSTAAYRADSLVLLVCPDTNNSAEGMVYTDAGEGYAYQQGGYEETQFIARIRNRQLTITARHLSGNWQKSIRFIKIGLVTDKGIRYSGWVKGPEATIRF